MLKIILTRVLGLPPCSTLHGERVITALGVRTPQGRERALHHPHHPRHHQGAVHLFSAALGVRENRRGRGFTHLHEGVDLLRLGGGGRDCGGGGLLRFLCCRLIRFCGVWF